MHAVAPNTPGAKDARLCFARVGAANGLTLLRVRLFTGRSHQIRVQLSHHGLPIWGDARYGGGKPGEQIALWGAHLALIHPTLKTPMHFERASTARKKRPGARLKMQFGRPKHRFFHKAG